ncbi:MAG: oligosaccharide flippase family protein [Faecalicoccus sp.]|nr:oligosaccharide flippase family protein [Faecalicoccus sp.]
MENNESKVKKSIILSGLVGTGGMFIAKLIGIVYAIPFSTILGSSTYMGIYGQAYNIYSYVLSVFTSGFPFAVATLVARYTVLDDNKTVLLVKKIALAGLTMMGFVGMIFLMAISGVIAPMMVAQDADVMANAIRVLSLAVFLVPVLSSFRGFYQGLKEMGQYAFSQAFEQLFRVGFLLSVCCIMVYVLKIERQWALYASVLSTSVAAIAAILQFVNFDQKACKPIYKKAAQQKTPAQNQNKVIRQFVILAIPYMISAVFSYSQQIYNAILLPIGLKMHSYTSAEITTIISATNYVGVKITAIPLILGPGFTAAIIPHITEALTKRDRPLIRKNILDCLNVVLFIGIPVSFCIYLFAGPINYVLFYTDNLEISTFVLSWLALEGFLGTLYPVTSNLLMALQLKKSCIRRLIIATILKGVVLVPLTAMLGFAGSVLASVVGDGYFILMTLFELKGRYNIDYTKTMIVVARIMVAIFAMWLVSSLLNMLGLSAVSGSRIMAFFAMALNGIVSVAVFLGVSILLRIPQNVFHVELDGLVNKVLRRGA